MKGAYTFIPAQKAVDDLWSQVYTIALRTCFPARDKSEHSIETTWQKLSQIVRFGAVSSKLS
jgi:hypothetical protein